MSDLQALGLAAGVVTLVLGSAGLAGWVAWSRCSAGSQRLVDALHRQNEQLWDRMMAANLGQYREFHPAERSLVEAPPLSKSPIRAVEDGYEQFLTFRDPVTGQVIERVPLSELDPNYR